MNNLLLRSSSPYEVDPYIRTPEDREAVYLAEPNESGREELLLQKLGEPGWGRLHLFRYYYNHDWGEDARPALSPKALDAFFRFLEDVKFPAGRRPSVFLTDEGGLELVWEDADGKSVQVEFHPHGVEYFRAANDEEGTSTFQDLRTFAIHLSG